MLGLGENCLRHGGGCAAAGRGELLLDCCVAHARRRSHNRWVSHDGRRGLLRKVGQRHVGSGGVLWLVGLERDIEHRSPRREVALVHHRREADHASPRREVLQITAVTTRGLVILRRGPVAVVQGIFHDHRHAQIKWACRHSRQLSTVEGVGVAVLSRRARERGGGRDKYRCVATACRFFYPLDDGRRVVMKPRCVANPTNGARDSRV
mmetsp:Transcript_22981/g.70357  ORF Transcript_22981/g.70357 Transcript_22981/m.70357 type:complete len:208 (+) Transcript_22981:857-1480(+)